MDGISDWRNSLLACNHCADRMTWREGKEITVCGGMDALAHKVAEHYQWPWEGQRKRRSKGKEGRSNKRGKGNKEEERSDKRSKSFAIGTIALASHLDMFILWT